MENVPIRWIPGADASRKDVDRGDISERILEDLSRIFSSIVNIQVRFQILVLTAWSNCTILHTKGFDKGNAHRLVCGMSDGQRILKGRTVG